MKIPSFSLCHALMAAVCGLTAPGLFAQDLTPPIVVNPISDITVAAGTDRNVIKLTNTFGLTGVTGQVVRMATVLGNIDIEMLASDAPANVANFLAYVNSGEYNGTFIHRSEPGFVIQGGGYYVTSSEQLAMIAQNPAVVGEHKVSNTRGTLALALSNGPDSGTSQWFFNLADNNQSPDLDNTSDGGPFTVFGRVIEADMTTVDAIAALPIPHPPQFDLTSPFYDVPLVNYDATAGLQASNLVYLNDVVVIPLIPLTVGADSVLTLKVKNNNPDLVTAKITGKKLKLIYTAGKTGTAKIKVFATDSTGTRTKAQFHVTVQ